MIFPSARCLRFNQIFTLLLTMLVLQPALASQNEGVGQRVFVSNEWADNITVFDTASLERVKHISVCQRPRDLEWGPDQRYIYVACGIDNSIGVVDSRSLEMVRTIPEVPEPEAFAITRDGTLYVTNEDAAKLSAIDVQTGETLGMAETAQEPEGVTVEPGEDRVWVTTESANMIHVMQLPDLELEKDIVVGTRPRRVAARPGSQEMWVTSELSGGVDIIDRDTLAVVDSFQLAPPGSEAHEITPVGMAFSDDGSTAWIALGRGDAVVRVDTEKRSTGNYIATGARPWNLTLDEAGNRLYVANGPEGTVSVIDTNQQKLISTLESGDGAYDVLLEPRR